MVVVASLGADIVPGDFVVAKKHSSSNGVCRVRCIVLPKSFEVEWWKEKMNSPPICPTAYQNIIRSRLRELSPAESATSVIHSNDVVDVAFVFSAEVLENMWTDLAGMTKVFFYENTESYYPFSLTITKSYPSRIWFSLLSVKELVRKMMSCKRQHHLCKSAESIPFSLESWRYISMFMLPVYYQKNQTKAHQFSDLSLQSKSSVKTGCLI
jgi:hypothetical protein